MPVPLLLAVVLVFLQLPEVPVALTRLLEARQSLVTGDVRWRRTTHNGSNIREDLFHSRFVGSQRLMAAELNESVGGGILLKPDGTPFIGPDGSTYHAAAAPNMLSDAPGSRWLKENGKFAAQWFDSSVRFSDYQVPDVRAIGAGLSRMTGSIESALLGQFDEIEARPVKITQEQDGALVKVTAVYPEASKEMWLDPEQGWSPLRAIIRDATGTLAFEILTEFGQFDGHWFPTSSRSYRGPAKSGELFEEVRIEAAEFNRPEHPLVLRPADIGIKVGTTVEKMSEKLVALDMLIWDGTALVAPAEFREAREAGRVYFESDDSARAPTKLDVSNNPRRVRDLLSAWEKYTAEFIDKYKLSGEQSATAWRILRSAQESAIRVLRSDQKKIEQLESKLSAVDREDAAAQASLEEDLKRVLSPVEKVFERELKARLERIPTRKQRENAK